MTIRVVSPEGKPLRGAVLDWGQADSNGQYYFSDYTLRGRVSTDDNGLAEVLTVAPGEYGALGGIRSGHFHIHVHAPRPAKGEKAHDGMTTQIYVKERNDDTILDRDP